MVKKLADALDTTVGYLLSETKQSNFLKDTAMVKKLNDLNNLTDKDKEYILYSFDGLIKSAKLKALLLVFVSFQNKLFGLKSIP